MSNLASNTNLLSPVSFKLIINSTEFANIEFFTVSSNIPGVSLTEATAGYRNEAGWLPGDKMQYDPLTVRIGIDENMIVYKELFEWMRYNTKNDDLKIRDITLIVLSSHNNPAMTLTFVNAFPTNIGQIDFNSQMQDVEYAFIDVTFRYDYFKVSSGNNELVC